MNYWEELCLPFPGLSRAGIMILAGIACLIILLALTITCIPCVFACIYKAKVVDRRQPFPTLPLPNVWYFGDFRFRLFDCFADMSTCCHAFWCMECRAADTHHAAGTVKFVTIILWFVACSLGGAIVGSSTGTGRLCTGLVTAAVMTSQRKKLREKLGIAPGDSCKDFMAWWWCSPCIVAQEAREVDLATGTKVHCCCNLQYHGSARSFESMVGPAVLAASGPLAQPLQANPQPSIALQPMSTSQTRIAPQVSEPVVAQVIHIQPPAQRTW